MNSTNFEQISETQPTVWRGMARVPTGNTVTPRAGGDVIWDLELVFTNEHFRYVTESTNWLNSYLKSQFS